MRKGQAAMEFLMTYGWAILVVLVAIGALAYFGVLSPSKFLPKSCTLEPGMGCEEFKADLSDNNVQLLLRNGGGSDLTSVTVAVEGCTGADSGADGNDIWYDGKLLGDATAGIKVTTCGLGAVGTSVKKAITITYTKGGIEHTASGEMTTKVEA